MGWKTAILVPAALLCSCGDQGTQPPAKPIKVTSAEQRQLHQFDALNLAIALKRAIRDAGLNCTRITDAGFVGEYQNLDMWMARCDGRDWGVFAGPDGSAQVRDCADVKAAGLPACEIKERPKGSFDPSAK